LLIYEATRIQGGLVYEGLLRFARPRFVAHELVHGLGGAVFVVGFDAAAASGGFASMPNHPMIPQQKWLSV